jgi:hypothetical protein
MVQANGPARIWGSTSSSVILAIRRHEKDNWNFVGQSIDFPEGLRGRHGDDSVTAKSKCILRLLGIAGDW